MKCLRCEQPLEPLDRAEQIQFWRCAQCQRDYAETGGQLTDRWLSPISLVLYGIIFSPRPHDDAERIADQFLRDRTGGELDTIVAEIREELAQSKQRVAEILPLQSNASEADVREFLRRVADRITSARRAGASAPT